MHDQHDGEQLSFEAVFADLKAQTDAAISGQRELASFPSGTGAQLVAEYQEAMSYWLEAVEGIANVHHTVDPHTEAMNLVDVEFFLNILGDILLAAHDDGVTLGLHYE